MIELSDLEENTTGQSTNQESLMVAICGMGKSCQSALDGVTSEWTSWQRLLTGHRLKRQKPLGRPIGSAREAETEINPIPDQVERKELSAQEKSDLMIESDVSQIGWGATSQGI